MKKFYRIISLFLVTTMVMSLGFIMVPAFADEETVTSLEEQTDSSINVRTISSSSDKPYDADFGEDLDPDDNYQMAVFYEDFESSSLGPIEANSAKYKYDYEGIFQTNTVVEDNDGDHGKVLEMPANTAERNMFGSAYAVVTSQYPTGTENQLNRAKLQVDIKLKSKMNVGVSMLTYTTNQFVSLMKITSDGKIRIVNYGEPDNYVDYIDYELNKWYSFVLYLDSETATYTFYCNQKLVGKGYKWGTSPRNGIRHIRVEIPQMADNTDKIIYIDNMLISAPNIEPDAMPEGYDNVIFYDDFDGNYFSIDGLNYPNGYYEAGNISGNWVIDHLKSFTNDGNHKYDAALDPSYKNDTKHNKVAQIPRCVSTSQNGYMGIGANVFRAQYPDIDGQRLKVARISLDVMLTTNKSFSFTMHNYPQSFYRFASISNGVLSMTGTVSKSSNYDRIAQLGLNRWHNLVFYVNTDTRTVTLYVDGVLMGSSIFTNTELAGIDRFRVDGGATGADTREYIYVDNIEVHAPNKYTITEASLTNEFDDVPVSGASIVYTFSNQISMVPSSEVTITKESGEVIDHYEVITEGNILRINFSGSLDYATTYTVTLGTGLRDTFGQTLTAGDVRSFTTMEEGVSATVPSFCNSSGNVLSVMPSSGAITATTDVINPFDMEKEAVLLLAVYDADDSMIALEKEEALISPNSTTPLSATINLNDYEGCYAKAFVCDNMTDLNLLNGEYGLLTSNSGIAVRQSGKGNSEILHGSAIFDKDDMVISAAITPAAQRTMLICVTNQNDEIDMLMPIVCDEDGNCLFRYTLTGEDGVYNVKITGRKINNTYTSEIFYTSENTRNLILSQVNKASSVSDIRNIIEQYKVQMNIDNVLLNNNGYQTLYEQKPLNDYSDIISILMTAYTVLEEINTADWSALSEIIKNHKDIVLKGNSDYSYYSNLSATNQNKINQMIINNTPYTDFKAFREGFSSAVSSYKSSLGNNKGGATGGGGRSGGSINKSNYIIETSDSNIDPSKDDEINIFVDIDSVAWAKESIHYLYERGIISGDGNKRFRPLDLITREEFVKLLVEAFGLSGHAEEVTFTDVQQDAWYSSYVAKAQQIGIASGYADGSFGVGQSITRQDMAVMLYRAAVHLNQVPEQKYDRVQFVDESDISVYAKEAVYQMQQAGIIAGVGEGLFAPLAYANRAQAVTMIYNLVYDLNEEGKA